MQVPSWRRLVMYNNPFVSPLDNLLARLCIADRTGTGTLCIVRVVFFKVVFLGETTSLRDGAHIPFPFTKSVASSGVIRPSVTCRETAKISTSSSWHSHA